MGSVAAAALGSTHARPASTHAAAGIATAIAAAPTSTPSSAPATSGVSPSPVVIATLSAHGIGLAAGIVAGASALGHLPRLRRTRVVSRRLLVHRPMPHPSSQHCPPLAAPLPFRCNCTRGRSGLRCYLKSGPLKVYLDADLAKALTRHDVIRPEVTLPSGAWAGGRGRGRLLCADCALIADIVARATFAEQQAAKARLPLHGQQARIQAARPITRLYS